MLARHKEIPHFVECHRISVCWSGGGIIVGGRQRSATRHANVRVQPRGKDTRARNRVKLRTEKLGQLEELLLLLKVGGEGEGLT